MVKGLDSRLRGNDTRSELDILGGRMVWLRGWIPASAGMTRIIEAALCRPI